MTLHESQRRELWQTLSETLGEDNADTLLTLLTVRPMTEHDTRVAFATLTETLRAEIRAEGEAVRAELREQLAKLDWADDLGRDQD